MPINVSPTFRRESQAQETFDQFITFLTISHPRLNRAVRVADDTVDYRFHGKTYRGFPFDAELPGNTPGTRGKLTIQNVDQEIGDRIRALTETPRLTFELVMASQFDDLDPETDMRLPLDSTVVVDLTIQRLRLARVQVDALWVTADVSGPDYSLEPWPYLRATKDCTPGLFRR